MQYKQIHVTSLLNKIIKKDNLFKGNYTLDPYQNCEFGCLYCDSSFDKTIYIKSNAAEIFEKELKKYEKGTIIIGSVHDPYQNAEKNYKLTQKILEKIYECGFSCHILTKSDLILRDIDIIKNIKNCQVTLSITSLRDKIFKTFEENVPAPNKRLQTIKHLSSTGIKAGLAIIPSLPYLIEEEIETIIKSAKENDACYIINKHLELKGDQKNVFFDIIRKHEPSLLSKYENLYKDSISPDINYVSKLNKIISDLCEEYGLKNKI